MKKIIVALLVLTGGFGICSMASGAISGSAHDFSNKAWSSGQICLPCHAPHNNSNVDDAPLWNHTVSDAVYELYTSPTFTADDITQPGGVSKLCLSCHDGTIAIDAFGGSEGSHYIGEGKNVGTDLSNDHPISFTYDTALVTEDGGLFDPTTTLSGVTGSTGSIDADMLFASRMECASCHDVHNKYDISRLLKVDNSGSALCLTCHDK
ncbi:MAG: putative CXXCH cytochrome family protein [Desulforhopalus sp.]|jgi:predicted CXXCH cytochrome family protein